MTDAIEIYDHKISIEIYNKQPAVFCFPDFKIGSIELAVHLDIKDIGSLDQGYAKQLLLHEPSSFESGRVPIYVCFCGDLACGAITVLVEEHDDFFKWSEIGRESNWSESHEEPRYGQTEYMKRTGPFHFDKVEYKNAMAPFLKIKPPK